MSDEQATFENVDSDSVSKINSFYHNGKLSPVILCKYVIDKYIEERQFVVTPDKTIWQYNRDEGIFTPDGDKFILKEISDICGTDYCSYIGKEALHWFRVQTERHVEENIFDSEKRLLCLDNGVYDIDTNMFLPHNYKYYFTTKLPIYYEPTARIDKIDTFLREILNEEDIPIIQELFGYLLYKDYHIHRAFMFDGSGANGKSTLLSLMSTFVGENNVCNVSLQDVSTDKFIVSQLYKKLANIYSDLTDKAIYESGIFKILTGQDRITCDVKFKSPITFRNYAKLVYSCNKIPIVNDDTDAFYRRWTLISFPNQFLGDDADPQLIDKLTTDTELSGLFNWSIDGLQRLLKNGRFTNEKTLEDIKEEFVLKSDPIKAFIHYQIVDDSNAEVSKSDVYEAYVNLCKEKKLRPLANNVFSREIKKSLPFIREGRTGKERFWKGIRLNVDKPHRITNDVWDEYL